MDAIADIVPCVKVQVAYYEQYGWQGMKAFCEAHPDVPVYAASMDEKLNEHSYIVPGLGDAGDRIFGTK